MVRFSIKQKIFSIIFLVLASMLLFTTLHLVWMVRAERAESYAKDLETARSIATFVDGLIDHARVAGRTLALHPAVTSRNAKSTDRLFAELLPEYPFFLNIIAADMQGANYGSGVRFDDARRVKHGEFAWFQKARAGTFVVDDGHVSLMHRAVAAMIAEPMRDKGKQVGVIGLSLDLRKVRDFIAKQWRLPDRSTIDVINARGGNLICVYFAGGRSKDGEEKESCLVLPGFLASEGSSETVGPDGIRRLYSFTQLANTHWTVIVGVPVSEAFAQVYGMTGNFIFMLLAGTALASVLGWLLSMSITRNVSALAAGLKAVEGGDLDHAIPVSGGDELSDAALSFNRMTEERKRAEEALRTRGKSVAKHNQALVELARNEEIYAGDRESAFRAVTEAATRALGVQRVGIWFYTDAGSGIRGVDLYDAEEDRHSEGVILAAVDFPSYFKAMGEENVIAAHDAHTDPRTREFTAAYLTPLGITSMLDVPIRVGGRVVGVICHEHVGPPRRWTAEEQGFVTAIAGTVSMAIEAGERRRVEEALKENERKLRNIIEHSNEMFYIHDKNHRFFYMSRQSQDILGYTPEEMMSQWTDFVTDNPANETAMLMTERALNTGERQKPYLVEVYRKDKTRIWLEIDESPLKNDTGDVIGIVGAARDVTERRFAEERLRVSNRALRTLSACNEALVRAEDENDLLQTVCDTIVRENGYRMCRVVYAEHAQDGTTRVVARAGQDGGYPDTIKANRGDSPPGRVPESAAIRTGKVLSYNDIMNAADLGPWREEALRCGCHSLIELPLKIGTDTFGMLAVYASQPGAFDENESKLLTDLANDLSYGITMLRTDRDRKQKEKFILNVFESMGEGLVVIDPEFRIISANREYCRKVHVALSEIIGRHCHEVSHHRQGPCYEAGESCPPHHTFRTGEPCVAVHTHYDKEGEAIYSEVKSYPLKDESGNVTSVIEIHNDVTEKRRLEEQLHQAQKMEAVGTLAGGIAHDFNNILSTVIGYTHVALMKMKDDEPLRHELEQVLTATERATTLTQGLLAFSRKQPVKMELLDISELTGRFEKFLRRLIREDIELLTRYHAGRLTVMADQGQIEQVLMNLSTNARDAMPQGGRLIIETGRVRLDEEFINAHGYGTKGDYALITVTDTGEGMDERTRRKIFEPFFTTKEQGKGTGLGLAMVYGIVKKHDGFINVYSEPGKGTTFRIYLPVDAGVGGQAGEEEKRPDGPVRGGTETVLVAEDDDALRKLTTTVLRHYGYAVIEAMDGMEALQGFVENQERLDLVLLDGIMPKKSGIEVFREIRALDPHMLVILLSGYAEGVLDQPGMRDERLHFLQKPISPANLLRNIREILDRKTA